jgi:hypothetical protein
MLFRETVADYCEGHMEHTNSSMLKQVAHTETSGSGDEASRDVLWTKLQINMEGSERKGRFPMHFTIIRLADSSHQPRGG